MFGQGTKDKQPDRHPERGLGKCILCLCSREGMGWDGGGSRFETSPLCCGICVLFHFSLSLLSVFSVMVWRRASRIGEHETESAKALKECSPPGSLIRTCHRSNEYHLNCFVYESEFGCRFNLRMCLSSSAWLGE